jgi:hypothetical protein
MNPIKMTSELAGKPSIKIPSDACSLGRMQNACHDGETLPAPRSDGPSAFGPRPSRHPFPVYRGEP